MNVTIIGSGNMGRGIGITLQPELGTGCKSAWKIIAWHTREDGIR